MQLSSGVVQQEVMCMMLQLTLLYMQLTRSYVNDAATFLPLVGSCMQLSSGVAQQDVAKVVCSDIVQKKLCA